VPEKKDGGARQPVPKAYGEARKSPLTTEVKEGDNILNVNLKGEGGEKSPDKKPAGKPGDKPKEGDK
jgi:hypothetical protein